MVLVESVYIGSIFPYVEIEKTRSEYQVSINK